MARAERVAAARAGADAEAFAARFLEAKGLRVVARNVRSRYGEIDLVCRDGATLVFVEVRYRRSTAFGGAAASITAAKRSRLVAACESYLATLPSPPPCRIDAVLVQGVERDSVQWLRDVVS